jgi:transcriptional regulator with XRE-family HTH domain
LGNSLPIARSWEGKLGTMGWTQQPEGRSLTCNGETVRFHRNHLGWTQQQLADRAGYSSRVIAKAEADGSLSPATIEHLADALSTADRPVYPEDLVFAPKVIARKFLEYYARYEEKCAEYWAEFLADDAELIVPGDPAVLPFCGVYKGKEGFAQFWQKFFSVMQRHDKELIVRAMRVFAEANHVIVLTSDNAAFIGQPGPYPSTPLAFIFEFERGKLKRMEDHFNSSVAEARVLQLLTESTEAREALGAAQETKEDRGGEKQ